MWKQWWAYEPGQWDQGCSRGNRGHLFLSLEHTMSTRGRILHLSWLFLEDSMPTKAKWHNAVSCEKGFHWSPCCRNMKFLLNILFLLSSFSASSTRVRKWWQTGILWFHKGSLKQKEERTFWVEHNTNQYFQTLRDHAKSEEEWLVQDCYALLRSWGVA